MSKQSIVKTTPGALDTKPLRRADIAAWKLVMRRIDETLKPPIQLSRSKGSVARRFAKKRGADEPIGPHYLACRNAFRVTRRESQ